MDNPPPTTPMSPGDFARLDALERRIATGWDQAALAWDEIKSAKLYRTTREGKSQTWEQYCQRVHGITPQWANKLISRAAILQRSTPRVKLQFRFRQRRSATWRGCLRRNRPRSSNP